jgi:hypothetical protein
MNLRAKICLNLTILDFNLLDSIGDIKFFKFTREIL